MSAAPDVVLAVRSDSFSGVERYVCDVAGALHDRGWGVSVVGGEPQRMRHELPDDVQYAPATTTRETAVAIARQGRARIVHAHMTAAETAAIATKPVTRARIVSTRHFAGPRGSRAGIRGVLAAFARGIDREVAISHFVAEATGSSPSVILNGVRSCDEVREGEPRQVLVMQRLEPEKDTATALRAWALSGLGDQGWRLVIAGRGSQRPSLEALAANLGITASVEFTGFVDDPRGLRRESAALLATAPAEPYGLAVVEAMAVGLPVIAAYGGAHLETVASAGAYYLPGDPRSCAEILRTLPQQPSHWRALGELGRERQRAELSLDAHVDRLELLYREVL